MVNLHNVGFAFSIDFHLKESLNADFFLALRGPGLRALLLSIWGRIGTRQGKQAFGSIPQFSKTPPPSLSAASSTERLEISSRNTGGFTWFEGQSDLACKPTSLVCKIREFALLPDSQILSHAKVPVGSFSSFCCGSVEWMHGALPIISSWIESFRDEILDIDARSKPFNDMASAEFEYSEYSRRL